MPSFNSLHDIVLTYNCVFIQRHCSIAAYAADMDNQIYSPSWPVVCFRRETFNVSDKYPATDSNDNIKSSNAAVAVPQTPDPHSPQLDYRFSVGQLPTWAKRQVCSLCSM